MQLLPPLRSAVAVPYLAPAPCALAAADVHRLSAAAAASVAASALVTGIARSACERLRIARRRQRVDRWLAWSIGEPPPDALICERMRQLVTPPERRRLARTLRAIGDQGVHPGIYRSSVVNPRAAAANRAAIERLASRLEAIERPVSARGVACAAELLADGAGPLYNPRCACDLGPALARALSRL
jgi:hypothetical protein